MEKKITIKKKNPERGDDGHKVVSVRMTDELISTLDDISSRSNRSRNEIINILLEKAAEIVEIKS